MYVPTTNQIVSLNNLGLVARNACTDSPWLSPEWNSPDNFCTWSAPIKLTKCSETRSDVDWIVWQHVSQNTQSMLTRRTPDRSRAPSSWRICWRQHIRRKNRVWGKSSYETLMAFIIAGNILSGYRGKKAIKEIRTKACTRASGALREVAAPHSDSQRTF